MKIACPPGFKTDMPPAAATPFWYYGSNIRFRAGMPETIGLFAPVINTGSDMQLVLNLSSPMADFYSDSDKLVVGHGDTLSVVDWLSGAVTDTVVSAGSSGRWWFASTEDGIVAGRSSITGTVHTIRRDTGQIVPLGGTTPDGAIAGGIVAGILIFAGAQPFTGDARKMTIRWSARQDDPSSDGINYGFEDWTPSDVNSSGELLLEGGSHIVGGGATEFGFVAWTDTRMHLLTPRTDTYVFNERPVGTRGLLTNKSWIEADSRIWWIDPTRTLNVFDGGSVRQIFNPLRQVTVEAINEQALERCYMSSIAETREVLFHYPDASGAIRSMVYNYADDAWSTWTLDRVAWTNSHGIRPSIAIDSTGRVFAHDLREVLPAELFDQKRSDLNPTPGPGLLVSGRKAEPFSFFLMTNQFTPGEATLQSLRSRNLTLSHVIATPNSDPIIDRYTVRMRSYGSDNILEAPTIDEQELDVGHMLAQLRTGGKRLQLVVEGTAMTTMMRFGEIDVDADPGGRR